MGLAHLLALHSLSDIGSVRLAALLDYFDGNAEAAWLNPDEWPAALQGLISAAALQGLRAEQRQVDVMALYERFLRSDAKVVTRPEPHYPKLLASIKDAPYLLFYRGQLPGDYDLCVAVIGSRRASSYGREAARFLADGLAKAGVWVVAGLARGVDSAAHRSAIDAGGKTIGVLGCGIDIVYPRENRPLFAEMAEKGCIISEYPLGMQPLSKNFPIRNRVVSGLSQGVIVVEAGLKSGTQITVNYALEQGRNIYAVPGSIFSPSSMGTHSLIQRSGVKLVPSAADVLEDFQPGRQYGTPGGLAAMAAPPVQQTMLFNMPPGLNSEEERLWQALAEQRHFNELLGWLNMEAAELGALLTGCELDGWLERLDGQYFIRKNII